MTALRMWEWLGKRRAGGTGDSARTAPSRQRGSLSLHTLTVTNDRSLLEQLTCVLDGHQHQHVGCRNVRSARNATRARRPNLAIVDWRLPGDGARQLIGLLRDTTSQLRCHVLAMVASDREDDLRDALLNGADDYLLIPAEDDILDARITVVEARITEHDALRTLQLEQQQAYERFLIAAAGSEDGVWDWSIGDGTIHLSERWRSMLGYEEHEIDSPEAWLDLVHEDDRPALQARLESHIAGDLTHLAHRYRIRHRDGSYRWVLARAEALRDTERRAYRVVGRQTAISDPSADEPDESPNGFHDPLTQLPNRAMLSDRLRQAFIKAGRRKGSSFAVLFFDLDRFKNINDSFGHIIGDTLLRSIAARIAAACTPECTLARFGGDEFVVLVENVSDVKEATRVAGSLQEQLLQPFEVDGSEVYVTISIGIVLWKRSYGSPGELLRDADTAMYRAKARGGSCYAVFDEQMHAAVVHALRIENELRRALVRNELRCHFQPIVSVVSGRITGFEALVRWQHPERGLLRPGEFISVAEDVGLIIQIDRWVAAEACAVLRHWQGQFRQDPPLQVSVNVSTTQFMLPDLTSHIDYVLRKSGLWGHSLVLEVTESAVMEDAAYASDMFKQLRALNIGISIDDFGTGYSSLAYLRRFEVDTIKIDYSFVSKMLINDESLEIVRSIINLAQNLGKRTVAEGVESVAQLEALQAMGIDSIQGNLVAPPLPGDEVERLLIRTAIAPNPLRSILENEA